MKVFGELFIGEGKSHAEIGEENEDNEGEAADAEDERKDASEGAIFVKSIGEHQAGNTDGGEDN